MSPVAYTNGGGRAVLRVSLRCAMFRPDPGEGRGRRGAPSLPPKRLCIMLSNRVLKHPMALELSILRTESGNRKGFQA
jgi:hypothetical protein